MVVPLIAIGGYAAFEGLWLWLDLATVTAATAVVIAENMNEANKAAGSSQFDTTSYADACSSCQPPPDEEGEDGKDARDAKRISSNKEADRIARNNGFKDAHDLKRNFGLDSRSDIFIGKNGRVYAGAHNGRGVREWLGIYRD